MKKILCLFTFLISNMVFCQYEAIDKKLDEMPQEFETSTTSIATYITQNFTTDSDKIRAAFYWTTSRISYDVENMYKPKPQTTEEKIATALKTRKGVCMHYAEVFNDIANKAGVKSFVIDGYTKQFGKIAPLAHSWNACLIDGKWCLFDPTWGAGYVNEQVFYRKLNNDFYKSEAHEFLKTHMPFDYMWQLITKPITNDEFYQDKTESDLISNAFDFNAAIVDFVKLSEQDKILKRIERIEKTGLKNAFITDKYNLLKTELENYKNNSSIPKLERIVAEYNEANNLLNDFIRYRNNRFVPLVSDEEIKNKVQIPYDKLMHCQGEIATIVDISKENVPNFNLLKKTIADAKKRFDSQVNFVNEYLSKSNSERPSLFMIIKRK